MHYPRTDLRSRLSALRDALSLSLIEREVPVRLVLLAALSGEHLLLLGPPGTAKSTIARRLNWALREGRYFEHLMTLFSVPEELFGPLSIKALEEDRFERKVDGYLPAASVAFLDEVFKANGAILNSLLTLLNERKFDNGSDRIDTPLVSVVGASNELPEGPELAAIYDRFLLRFEVVPVSDEGFDELLELRGDHTDPPSSDLQLTPGDLKEIRDQALRTRIPEDVRALLKALRTFLAAQQIRVSDRRWRKALFLLQVSAITDARPEVSIWDGWLLQHCLWEQPAQRQVIHDWYCERLGATSPGEPGKFDRLVAAEERTLELEGQRRAQATDESGRLLYVAAGGSIVTRERSHAPKVDANGAPLYAPLDHQRRPNNSVGVTREELRPYFVSVSDLEEYLRRPGIQQTEEVDNKPHMEPMHYSAEHVHGRLKQVEQHLAQVGAHLEGLERQSASITDVVDAHLWIARGFSTQARAHVNRQREQIQLLKGRLTAVRAGIEALPRSPG